MSNIYYHITGNNKWGDKIVLYPRRPKKRAMSEPLLKRICVCPTIEGCIIALGNCLPEKCFIYKTSQETELPRYVRDSLVTGERWITVPSKFTKIGFFNRKSLPEQDKLNKLWAGGWFLMYQKRYYSILEQSKYFRRYYNGN
jgi:hypothetical protein